RSCGWRVVELRFGKKLQAALDKHKPLKDWFESLSNAELSALHYQGGAAWRTRIEGELGNKAAAFLKQYDDEALASLFTDLGGHCMETLTQAFDAADDDVPTFFIALTIKGFGLPFAGHKDNHAGLMNPTQMSALRDAMGVREGHEWEPLEGVGDNARTGVEALIDRTRIAREKRSRSFGTVPIPAIPAPSGDEQSTGSLWPNPARPVEGRRRSRRPHRHHLPRRHRLDQPWRVGQSARSLPSQSNGRH